MLLCDSLNMYGERVAFVVVYGPPGARLKDCVMPPLEVAAGAIAKPTFSSTFCTGHCEGRQRATQRRLLHHQVHRACTAARAGAGWC